MSERRYLQLDVFSASPAPGVALDAADQDAARMQRLAAWPNLPETVCFLPPDAGADYRIRIFTQGRTAIGHPSVGAAWAAVATSPAKDANSGAIAASNSWSMAKTCGVAAWCKR